MKICHMTSAHDSIDIRIFDKECCSLAKERDNQVFLVAAGGSYKKNGVTVIGVGKMPSSRKERMTVFAKLIYNEALNIDADIYHFHDPELLVYAKILKRKGKIVIYDSHENLPYQILGKDWIPKPLRAVIAKYVAAYERHACNSIDMVISVTPQIIERFNSYGVYTLMISNFPIITKELGYFDIEEYSSRKPIVFFAGGVSPQWMHESIVEAISSIDCARYRMAGASSSEYIDKIKQIDIHNKVEYRGVVAYREVEELYNEARIGIALNDYVPNVGYHEGTLGNTKLFEIMRAGIPVICTDFNLWSEIVNNKCGICVNPHNSHEISRAIEFLINNPRIAYEYGLNGRKAILDKYNWANEEKKLLSAYKIIGEKYEKNAIEAYN